METWKKLRIAKRKNLRLTSKALKPKEKRRNNLPGIGRIGRKNPGN